VLFNKATQQPISNKLQLCITPKLFPFVYEIGHSKPTSSFVRSSGLSIRKVSYT